MLSTILKTIGKSGVVTLRLPNGTIKNFTDGTEAALAMSRGAKIVPEAAVKVPPTAAQKIEDVAGGLGRTLARGTKPISQIARDVSKARQASARKKPGTALIPAGTRSLTTTSKEVKKPGTALVPAGTRSLTTTGKSPASTSAARKESQKKVQEVLRNIQKTNAQRAKAAAARTGSTKAAQTATRAKKLDNIQKMIAAAGLGAGVLAIDDAIKKKKTVASTPVPKPKPKPKAKVTPPMPKPKDKDRKTPRKQEPKAAAPKKTTSFTAGKNTGFGPKGNIFPGNAEERKALMIMYGGTGSKAGKAAIAGTQGNIAKGRSLLEAAKKKRLSKATTKKSYGGKMSKKTTTKKAYGGKVGSKSSSGCARQVKGFGAARRPPKK